MIPTALQKLWYAFANHLKNHKTFIPQTRIPRLSSEQLRNGELNHIINTSNNLTLFGVRKCHVKDLKGINKRLERLESLSNGL